MASINARVAKLEKQVIALKKALAKEHLASLALRDRCDDLETWVEAEVVWTNEVADMFHDVDWAKIVKAYPKKPGGGNPPQTPPDWPVP